MVREEPADVVWFTPVTKWTMSNHAMHPHGPVQALCGWSGRRESEYEGWRPKCERCQLIADREAAG